MIPERKSICNNGICYNCGGIFKYDGQGSKFEFLEKIKVDNTYDNDKDYMNDIIKFFIKEDCLFHLCSMEIISRFKNNKYGNSSYFKCFFTNRNNQHKRYYVFIF
ncbi:hypothetical protein DAPK24_034130 [Pichia kluyveri]|uniref:Uncharacterized protein n=1 Tax=Pichia kluyveri TaxID=36015 RepID=A0AAV5R6K1_PICKL|nr:hypothetical protein DAPK24_034130 [Pichia kluyveri]